MYRSLGQADGCSQDVTRTSGKDRLTPSRDPRTVRLGIARFTRPRPPARTTCTAQAETKIDALVGKRYVKRL
eukprot:7892798-Pyramimonas_sp.AAC.1